ncbi:MAG: hypothetical protein ACJAXF_002288 [Polaribacter sp.]|jgi:hypothetical protein
MQLFTPISFTKIITKAFKIVASFNSNAFYYDFIMIEKNICYITMP